jgi:hypothetical protein
VLAASAGGEHFVKTEEAEDEERNQGNAEEKRSQPAFGAFVSTVTSLSSTVLLAPVPA